MTATQITAEPGTPFIAMSREFRATPEQLLRAHTDPELLTQWLGPKRMKMKLEALEPRHGGAWRYLHIDDDGTEYGFHGVFHNDPSVEEGIVQTFEFEGWPGHVALERVTFTEVSPGVTRLDTWSVYQSVEDRDAMVQSDMETGVNEGYERLDDLLASLVGTAT